MAYWRTFYHIVWTTHERRPQIEARFDGRLFAEMLATAQRLGATVHAVNGTADHVHMVVSVPPTVALSAFVGQLKGGAAHFVNHECVVETPLVWERGYGLFTLGARQLPDAVAYVRRQKEHHAEGTERLLLERTEEP
jgi:REP element-mobilizing transposase RayT